MVGTKKQIAFIVFRKGRVCWNLVYVEKVVYVKSFDLQFFIFSTPILIPMYKKVLICNHHFFSSDSDSDV